MKCTQLFLLAIIFAILGGCATTNSQQGQVERITPEELAKLMPPSVANVTLDEIVADSKAGKKSDEIIDKIKTSNSRYDLTAAQILDLNKQGLDLKVLEYIQESNEKAKQNAMADEINKREQEKRLALKQLQRERAMRYNGYHDFYFGNPYFYPIGPSGRYWRGSRFGWGLHYGYPFYW